MIKNNFTLHCFWLYFKARDSLYSDPKQWRIYGGKWGQLPPFAKEDQLGAPFFGKKCAPRPDLHLAEKCQAAKSRTYSYFAARPLSAATIDDYGKDGGPHFTQCMIGICPLATHSYQNLQLWHKILTKATIDLGRRNFVVKSTHILLGT